MSNLVKQYKKNQTIRNIALRLISDLPHKAWSHEINRIFLFVRDRIRYVKDISNVETLHTPIKLLELGQGDCDDKATLAAALLESIGHPTRFVAIGFTPNQFSHVFVETKIKNKWLALETTERWPLGKKAKGTIAPLIHYN